MTNVGFGEVNVTKRGPVVTLGALVAMLGGITFTSIFIGYVSSALDARRVYVDPRLATRPGAWAHRRVRRR